MIVAVCFLLLLLNTKKQEVIMRKLASIQRIRKLEPIEGADAIEKALVLGWELVVKKGEHQPGDMVVYCEIDSLMPDRPDFEFLKPRGMRIRTIRLRGQISQGIIFPLTILPPDFEIKENVDCTEVLGITKYELPVPAYLSGKVKGAFPSFMPKTDETRVQVLQELLDKYKGQRCCVTEKLDGSSATYYLNNGEFGVCSRKLELYDDDVNSFWKVARQMNIEEKLRSLNRNISLQGELIGEFVQSNKYKLRGQTVRFFNAFDIDKYESLSCEELVSLLRELDLPGVPVITNDYYLENDVNAIVKMSVIKSTLNPQAWAEGIVIRLHQNTTDFDFSDIRGRLSFKAINPEFLLKYGE
jgi:RNA ligase (TIGR02306 family)